MKSLSRVEKPVCLCGTILCECSQMFFPGCCFSVKRPKCYRKGRLGCDLVCEVGVYASVMFARLCRPFLPQGKGLLGGTLRTLRLLAPSTNTHSSVSRPGSVLVLKSLSTHRISTQQTPFCSEMGCKSNHACEDYPWLVQLFTWKILKQIILIITKTSLLLLCVLMESSLPLW